MEYVPSQHYKSSKAVWCYGIIILFATILTIGPMVILVQQCAYVETQLSLRTYRAYNNTPLVNVSWVIYNQSVYWFVHHKVQYEVANFECTLHRFALLTIRSTEELSFITEVDPFNLYWIKGVLTSSQIKLLLQGQLLNTSNIQAQCDNDCKAYYICKASIA